MIHSYNKQTRLSVPTYTTPVGISAILLLKCSVLEQGTDTNIFGLEVAVS